MSNNNDNSSGVGLGGVLFIVFLVLELTGNITWSWWWVTAPLWGPLVLILPIIIIIAIVAAFID